MIVARPSLIAIMVAAPTDTRLFNSPQRQVVDLL
jgi:hypothetical protein